jgi:hypothetical protein
MISRGIAVEVGIETKLQFGLATVLCNLMVSVGYPIG